MYVNAYLSLFIGTTRCVQILRRIKKKIVDFVETQRNKIFSMRAEGSKESWRKKNMKENAWININSVEWNKWMKMKRETKKKKKLFPKQV